MMLTEMIVNIRKGIEELHVEKKGFASELEEALEFDEGEGYVENLQEEISAIDGEIEDYNVQLKRYEGMLMQYGEHAKLW